MTEQDQDSQRKDMWGGFGLAVVAVGVVLLLDNLGLRLPFRGVHNWWALFILVPVATLLLQAGARFRREGRVDRGVVHLLLSALGPLLVAVIFLVDLDWGVWWPVCVIYGGLWAMLGGRKKYRAA